MFKKKVGVKNFANLKNSDRKNLVKNLDYEIPSVVKKSSFKNDITKGTIYTDEQLKPIWFKLNDNEDLIPTIYTLWDHPGLFPVIRTHQVVIENHIVGGADLMLPGTVPPFDQRLTKGSLVAITSRENDLVAMAVGYLMVDVLGMDRVVGTTGVLVKVLHYYNDELWRLYKEKVPIPSNEELKLIVDSAALGKIAELVTEPLTKYPDMAQELDLTLATDLDENAIANELVIENNPVSEQNVALEIEDLAETLSELSTEDIDHFFHRSLLYSLTQDKIELPINSSNFMSNHINENLAIDSNIKKTSYKKTAKWLKHLEKLGYLKLKGKGDNLVIVEVLKLETNDELKNFVPYRVRKSHTQTPGQTAPASKSQLQVINLYHPQQRSLGFFDEVKADCSKLYQQQELRLLLNQYIKQENLVSPKDAKKIVLDETLSKVIKIKENVIARDRIFQEFLTKNFSKLYQITYLNGEKSLVYKGELPKIEIIMETPMGNKRVTKIRYPDFDILNINLKNLNTELKTKCSSSTTVTDTLYHPDGSKNNKGHIEIMVQGENDKIVSDLLTKQYGVPISWIEVQNKLKSRRKK